MRALAAVSVLALGGLAGLASVAAAQVSGFHRASVGAHYAKVVPVCRPPAPGQNTCFALRRLPATANTPGAERYVVPASYPVGPGGGYTPGDFWSAYGLGTQASLTAAGGPGTGSTVAIVDAYDDPNIESDLGTFDAQYNLPACTTANGCFTKVGQGGPTTALPAPSGSSGWAGETALDVETVHGVCPDCRIILVEANGTNTAELGAGVMTAVRMGATEVSNSYGGVESYSQPYEFDYNHSGVVITASSGDQGYYNWVYRVEGASNYPALANTPAAYPETVAVGGTSLALNSDGTRASESVWNNLSYVVNYHAGGAGGGGCSGIYTAQSWQSSASGYSAANCNGDRLVSDISADADPLTGYDVYDSYAGDQSQGWGPVGGTSLSAPLMAAIYGLAGGGHGVAYPAKTLYGHSGSLLDVTNGGNGYCNGIYPCTPPVASDDCGAASNTACNAKTGFDGPTGVGSPSGLSAFDPQSAPDTTSAGVSCTPASTDAGVATTCTATITDTAGSPSTPTGTVNFSSTSAGSFDSSTCTLTSTAGVASCQAKFTPSGGGSYTITASYLGDAGHDSSYQTSTALSANAATSTGVSCSPVSVVQGVATTCTATVTDTAGTPSTPTGTINFTATINGSFASNATCTLAGTGTTGVASCTDTFAPSATSGSFTVSGAYPGDGTHKSSNGTSQSLSSTAPNAPLDPTSTGVSCSPASVALGSATTCTATVTDTAGSPSTPAGKVDFTATTGGSFGSSAACTLAASGTTGAASCQDTFTPSGTGGFTVSGSYLGESTHQSSNGTSQALTSNPPSDATTTGVSCSPASVTQGSATTCTATVTDTAATPSTPAGTVDFSTTFAGSFSSSAACTLAATSTTGVATCQVTFTPSATGGFTVNGSYLGESTHQSSNGASQALTSNPPPDATSTGVSCLPASVVEGSATTCTATVTDTAGSPSTPTGTVGFTATLDGAFANSAACTLAGTGTTGVASCQDTFTPSAMGGFTVKGTYSDDGTHSASNGTSGPLSSTTPVPPQNATSTGVSCSPGSGTTGTPTTCTATVTDLGASPSTPTGTVAFTATITGAFGSSGACTLGAIGVTGVAACQVSFTPSGTGAGTITANYAGDSSHAASVGQASYTAKPKPVPPTPGRPSIGHVSVSGITASVPVICSGGTSCHVKLTLVVTETLRGGKVIAVSAKTTHKTLVLASKSVTVPPGKTVLVKLTLNGAGKSLLSKHSPMKVQMKAVTASGATVKTLTLTFKKPAAKRK